MTKTQYKYNHSKAILLALFILLAGAGLTNAQRQPSLIRDA